MKLKHFLLCVMGILIPTTVFSAEYYVVPGLRATGNDGSSWEKAITMYDIFENDATAAKNDEVSKYASKSNWTISDEVYIDENDAARAAKKKPSSGNNSSTNNSGNSQQAPSNVNVVGWILDGNRWYYRYPDGTYLKNGWGFIGNIWYLFDANGMMLTGWQMKNGVYYYMNGDGKMQTGWLLYNNTWYYLSESGAMVTGWITLGDKAYYLGGDGGMLTGWQNIDGQIYYLYPDGHKAVNEVIDTFYLDQDGIWRKPQ